MKPANQEMWNDLCKSVDLRSLDHTEAELIEEFNALIGYNVGLKDIINHFYCLTLITRANSN